MREPVERRFGTCSLTATVYKIITSRKDSVNETPTQQDVCFNLDMVAAIMSMSEH